jgi:hypothetical protein
MKFLLLIALTFPLTLNIFAQIETPQARKVGVEGIFLAKDDGEGNPGETVEGFLTTDIPIYCIVHLDSFRSATVKMNFIAVNVKGVKAETKVLTVNYRTTGKQNRVYFTGKPEGRWVAGTYRVDIFVDGEASGSKEFQIQNPALENPSVKPLQPRIKPSKRARKN